MSALPHITAIIPALNEEETIGSVIKGLLSQQVKEVIVVNNGSTDRTQEVAIDSGAQVISESQKGYGKACLSGLTALSPDTEWVLFCDADGSDDLSYLPDFWEQVDQYEFILGNRRATNEGRANLTPVQNFGNWLSGFLMLLGWGKGFSDLGPLRLIKRDALKELNMKDENFGWTVEMQAKALEKKLKTVEIPVGYLPRQGGVSKISGNFQASAKAGQIILSTLGKLWLERKVIQCMLLPLSLFWLLFGASLLGALGDPASASKAVLFLWSIFLMVLGYLFSISVKQYTPLLLFATAIIARLLLIPMAPGDDIWRYLWEGMIQNKGYNPYNTAPLSDSLAHLRTDQWDGINHKGVTAIYPPLTQLIFRFTALCSTSVLAFKILFLLADLAIGTLLWKKFGEASKLYLLNPLVMYSFVGGAHYDSLFLLPLVAAWLLWEAKHSRTFLIGCLLGLSISIKLVAILPAGFIGWLYLKNWKSTRFKRIFTYIMGLSLPIVGSYLLFTALSGTPERLIPDDFTMTARSASLIPWLTEFINFHPSEFIPNHYFGILFAIFAAFLLFSCRTFSGFQTKSFLALLAFSPMVHAWYFTWLIPFALKRHRITIILLSITCFIYFQLPFRQAAYGAWTLYWYERLFLWLPLIVLASPSVFTLLNNLVLQIKSSDR